MHKITNTKKLILLSILFLTAGLITGSVLHYPKSFETFNASRMTIILDAGHGSPDGGATGINGTVEKDINLAIVKKMQEIFEGKGINIILTRSDDNGLYDNDKQSIRHMKVSDMHKRLEIMKNSRADLFISIHMNSFPRENVCGLRLFYAKKYPETEALADYIQKNINEVTGAEMYPIKAADENLFLMKNPPLPSLLIECGFLTNREEEKKLNSEEYQSKIAWAIASSVEKYYTQKDNLSKLQ